MIFRQSSKQVVECRIYLSQHFLFNVTQIYFYNDNFLRSILENTMSENVYIWIIGGLLGLVNMLFWSRIKRIEKDVDETKKKSFSTEKNYLSRFEDLHNKLSEVEKNIIKEIYSIKLASLDASRSGLSAMNNK